MAGFGLLLFGIIEAPDRALFWGNYCERACSQRVATLAPASRRWSHGRLYLNARSRAEADGAPCVPVMVRSLTKVEANSGSVCASSFWSAIVRFFHSLSLPPMIRRRKPGRSGRTSVHGRPNAIDASADSASRPGFDVTEVVIPRPPAMRAGRTAGLPGAPALPMVLRRVR